MAMRAVYKVSHTKNCNNPGGNCYWLGGSSENMTHNKKKLNTFELFLGRIPLLDQHLGVWLFAVAMIVAQMIPCLVCAYGINLRQAN